MKLAEHILTRLETFGLAATIEIDTRRERESLLVNVNGEEKRIRIDPDWEDAYANQWGQTELTLLNWKLNRNIPVNFG